MKEPCQFRLKGLCEEKDLYRNTPDYWESGIRSTCNTSTNHDCPKHENYQPPVEYRTVQWFKEEVEKVKGENPYHHENSYGAWETAPESGVWREVCDRILKRLGGGGNGTH